MNKAELVSAVADQLGVENAAAERSIDAVFGAVRGAVVSGDKVSVAGFGTFDVRERSARQGRNPQTGESIQIAASKAPGFKPAKAFKDAVDQG